MGNFTYYDIFAAKGMDYLIAIICVLSLIVFWRWLRRPGEPVDTSSAWRSALIPSAVAVVGLAVILAVCQAGNSSNAVPKTVSSGIGAPLVYGIDLSGVPDGTFRGESRFGSRVCLVDVTVKRHAITAVEIADGKEGPRTPEVLEITRRVLDEQTPYVSAVSGATISTRTLLKAVEDALIQAK